jgi:hypothetical protein
MTSADELVVAYQSISAAAIEFSDGRAWDRLVSKFALLSGMVSAEWAVVSAGTVDERGGPPSKERRRAAMDAARLLKRDLLDRTGQRIWGLTFTLYPDGKFNIEYDYNKPEGYEETDEVVTGDEINASLNSLAGRDRPPS